MQITVAVCPKTGLRPGGRAGQYCVLGLALYGVDRVDEWLSFAILESDEEKLPPGLAGRCK